MHSFDGQGVPFCFFVASEAPGLLLNDKLSGLKGKVHVSLLVYKRLSAMGKVCAC
jgi:hypothetical protein